MGQWQPSEIWHDMQSIIVLSSVKLNTLTFSRLHLNTLLRLRRNKPQRIPVLYWMQASIICWLPELAHCCQNSENPWSRTVTLHIIKGYPFPTHTHLYFSECQVFVDFLSSFLKIVCRSVILRMVQVDQGMMGFDALIYSCTQLIANSVLCVRHLILDLKKFSLIWISLIAQQQKANQEHTIERLIIPVLIHLSFM